MPKNLRHSPIYFRINMTVDIDFSVYSFSDKTLKNSDGEKKPGVIALLDELDKVVNEKDCAKFFDIVISFTHSVLFSRDLSVSEKTALFVYIDGRKWYLAKIYLERLI